MVKELSRTGEKMTQMPTVPKFAGLGWRELLRTTWREAAKTNIANRAAELAFWFLLGFFPMLLSVVSMVSTLSSASDSQTILMKYVGEVLPSAASNLVQQVLAQTASSGRAWFALLFALWSSSSATAGLIDTLNEIYGVKESRPWWQCRLIAVVLALAMGVLLTAALMIVVYGPILLHVLNVSSTLFVLKIAQWPAAAFLLILALLGLYRFAPNIRQQRLKWLLPGSVFAAVVWMVASILFKVYVRHFSHFGLLYGSLGTLIILMFWFYLSGIVILAGGEINAILEDAAARHKIPGAKRRGQRLLAKPLE
jgi:membrane protein